jgi:hypothetical protein
MDPSAQPTFEADSLAGLGTLSFLAGNFLEVFLKAQDAWHLFVVGRYVPAIGVRGTFFSAIGAESPFSGLEAKVYQLPSGHLQGTVFTWRHPSEVVLLDAQISPSSWGILEWSEDLLGIRIGLNGYVSTVLEEPGEDTSWDPTRLAGGNQIPLRANLGRSGWGLGAQPWDYLEGGIAEIVLYPRTLAQGQRIQVLNLLRKKWGLGAPILPPY